MLPYFNHILLQKNHYLKETKTYLTTLTLENVNDLITKWGINQAASSKEMNV